VDTEKLQSIITSLENENDDKRALFGIYEDGGIQNDTHIQANKEGLICFAITLLKAAENHDTRIEGEGLELSYPISFGDDWIDGQSDIFLNSIEPFPIGGKDHSRQPKKESFKEKIWAIGCIAFLILLVVAIFIGIGTIFEWII
jgi:hypothetical protein